MLGKCQHCGIEYPVKDGLLIYHDWPKFCRMICPGAKKPPVTAPTSNNVSKD